MRHPHLLQLQQVEPEYLDGLDHLQTERRERGEQLGVEVHTWNPSRLERLAKAGGLPARTNPGYTIGSRTIGWDTVIITFFKDSEIFLRRYSKENDRDRAEKPTEPKEKQSQA